MNNDMPGWEKPYMAMLAKEMESQPSMTVAEQEAFVRRKIIESA